MHESDRLPAHAALRRVVGAMVTAGDHPLFLFGDPSALAATVGTDTSWPSDDPARGVSRMLHGVASTVIRTLENGIRTR
jgi:hypothetical protein